MKKISPIQLNSGEVVYFEVPEDIADVDSEIFYADVNECHAQEEDFEIPEMKGGVNFQEIPETRFRSIKSTISNITKEALDSFSELTHTDIETVTLEFGLKIAGSAKILCITNGSAESHLKITVVCNVKKNKD